MSITPKISSLDPIDFCAKSPSRQIRSFNEIIARIRSPQEKVSELRDSFLIGEIVACEKLPSHVYSLFKVDTYEVKEKMLQVSITYSGFKNSVPKIEAYWIKNKATLYLVGGERSKRIEDPNRSGLFTSSQCCSASLLLDLSLLMAEQKVTLALREEGFLEVNGSCLKEIHDRDVVLGNVVDNSGCVIA